jgi:hypothetical protein
MLMTSGRISLIAVTAVGAVGRAAGADVVAAREAVPVGWDAGLGVGLALGFTAEAGALAVVFAAEAEALAAGLAPLGGLAAVVRARVTFGFATSSASALAGSSLAGRSVMDLAYRGSAGNASARARTDPDWPGRCASAAVPGRQTPFLASSAILRQATVAACRPGTTGAMAIA